MFRRMAVIWTEEFSSHIPGRRFYAVAHQGSTFSTVESAHLRQCKECQNVFTFVVHPLPKDFATLKHGSGSRPQNAA